MTGKRCRWKERPAPRVLTHEAGPTFLRELCDADSLRAVPGCRGRARPECPIRIQDVSRRHVSDVVGCVEPFLIRVHDNEIGIRPGRW